MTRDPNEPLAALLDLPPYGVTAEEKRVRLQAAMATELAHHLEQNADFKRFCARNGIEAADPARPLSEYPLLPALAFKRLGPRLLSVPPADVRFRLTSSATRGGAPSEVRIDAITAKRQTRALGRVLGDLLGPRRRPYVFLDVSPELTPHLLGARRAAVLGYMRQASSSHFVLRAGEDGQGLLLDEDLLAAASLAAAETSQAATPPVLFGFTYVLFDLLLRPWHRAGRKLVLPPGSAVLHIGGWKKLAAESVDKATFNAMAAEVLGVAPGNVFDVYGFTEQMGMNYPECPAGRKHVPAFGEVFVRDPVTLEPLPDGREGLLHFVCPLPHSYPGISVVTDDLGVIAGRDGCDCGRLGTAFQVTGRAALAEARGCGDVLADKYLEHGRPRARAGSDASWQVLLHQGEEPGGPLSPEDVIAGLRGAHDWLRRVPLEGLIALLAEAAQRWLAAPSLAPFRKQGLDFLAQWCAARQLRGMLDFAFGNRGALDGPVPGPVHSRTQWLLVPRGLAVHWVAGNVPLIGWFVLAQTILTRNLNVVKVPRALRHLLPAMVQELGRCEVRLPQGVVRGRDLVRTIAVVYHDHGHPAAETLSRTADVRVAWGGREAMEALGGLPRRYDCQDVFFGPKLSYMCIGREALAQERPYRRLLRHAAVDCSVFDQYGCASPHTIFVESGGRVTPEAFAADLAGEMARAAERIPPAGWDAGAAQAIRLRRIEYQMRHRVWHSADLAWTVLYDEEEGLAEPCYGRVVTVRGIPDVQRAAALAHPDVQSIGLELSGERRLAFAEAAAERGVCRLPDVGRMTHFEWIWDGFLPLERLVRRVTVGGP